MIPPNNYSSSNVFVATLLTSQENVHLKLVCFINLLIPLSTTYTIYISIIIVGACLLVSSWQERVSLTYWHCSLVSRENTVELIITRILEASSALYIYAPEPN